MSWKCNQIYEENKRQHFGKKMRIIIIFKWCDCLALNPKESNARLLETIKNQKDGQLQIYIQKYM